MRNASPAAGGRGRPVKGAHIAWMQLATRIPKSLHRRIKLHCLVSNRMLMDFITEAVEEKLARDRQKA